MAVTWDPVTHDHVVKAIEEFLSELPAAEAISEQAVESDTRVMRSTKAAGSERSKRSIRMSKLVGAISS